MHIYKDPTQLFKEVRRSLAEKRFKKICTSLEVIIEEHEDATFEEWLNIYRSYILLILGKVKSIVATSRARTGSPRSPAFIHPTVLHFCGTIIKRAEQRILIYSQLLNHVFEQVAPQYICFIEDIASTSIPGLQKIDKQKTKIIKAKTKVLELSQFNIDLHIRHFYKLTLSFFFTLVWFKRVEQKHQECCKMIAAASTLINNLEVSNEYTLRIRLLMNLNMTIRLQFRLDPEPQKQDAFPFRELQIVNDLLERKKTKKAYKYLNAVHNYIVLMILEAEDKMNLNKAFQYMDIGMHLFDIYKYIPRRVQWFYRDVRNRLYDIVRGEAQICRIVSMVFGTLNKAQLNIVEKYDHYLDEKKKENITLKETEKIKKQVDLNKKPKKQPRTLSLLRNPVDHRFKELSVVQELDSRRFNENDKVSSGSEIVTDQNINQYDSQKKEKASFSHSGLTSFNRLILHRPLIFDKSTDLAPNKQSFSFSKPQPTKHKSISFQQSSQAQKKALGRNALKIIQHSEKIVRLIRKESQSLKIVSEGTKARKILSHIQPITSELHPEIPLILSNKLKNHSGKSSNRSRPLFLESWHGHQLVPIDEKKQKPLQTKNIFLGKFRSLSHNILMSSVSRKTRPDF